MNIWINAKKAVLEVKQTPYPEERDCAHFVIMSEDLKKHRSQNKKITQEQYALVGRHSENAWKSSFKSFEDFLLASKKRWKVIHAFVQTKSGIKRRAWLMSGNLVVDVNSRETFKKTSMTKKFKIIAAWIYSSQEVAYNVRTLGRYGNWEF